MRLFSWLRGEQKADDAMSVLREFLQQYQAKSGVAVNHITALRAVTALACARVIAEGLAQVPLKVYRSRKSGGRDVARDHPLHNVIAHQPNEWQTSYDWRETAGLHMVFAGNEIAYINRVRGEVVELLPYAPSDVRMERVGMETRYQLKTGNDSWTTVPAQDILHLRGPSWSGWKGLDGVDLAREAIGLSLATEEHGSRLFKNGAQPGGLIYSDGITTLTKEQRDLLRDSWQESHGGGSNAHKTAILWGGLKWMSTAQQNDQAQFLETRGFQVEEVCRAFRVLPVMVGHSDKAATYASAEQMFLAHVVHTMGPWYARIEQAADIQLLSKQERAAGYYTKFSVSALLRGAHKDRAEYFAKALGAGGSPAWMTQDEVRDLEELNPMGGSASELAIATNVGDGTKNNIGLLDVKELADSYGASVRAGVITPQKEDEQKFRELLDLPSASKVVLDAWESDGGVRRPITLKSGAAFDAEQNAVSGQDTGDNNAAP